ncbi:Omega-crystallin [Dactylella cylindrospora]|nr:Omega-crystallin [Dactylella cylindrospora]
MSFEKDTSFCVPLWINGSTQLPPDSPKFPVTTPPSQSLAWSACAASTPTINLAISTAAQAFPSWSKTPLSTRTSIFLKAGEILESKGDEVHYYFQKEIGGGEGWSSFNLNFCVNALKGIGEILEGTLQKETIVGKDGIQGTVSKVPYGVVGAIAPWNAPLILGLRSILAPIAAGNTVVMLAAPLSPMIHHFLAILLHAAGLPAGVLNILPAPPAPADAAEAVETLLKHPSVRFLNFTGSTAVGRKINEVAGRYGKPVTMELGGKCVTLALEDAELDLLAKELVVGAYLNSGQICMSTEHAIIPTPLISQLISKLKTTVTAIFPAPLPLITTLSKQKILTLLSDAVAKGAVLHNSTLESISSTLDSDSSFPPVFLSNVTKDMAVYSTETFGPVFCIVGYDGGAEEGVKLVNELEYGLSVSVFSKDEERAVEVAEGVDSGAVHVNHMTVYDNPSFPHGGVKASGYGRFGGKWGIEEFTYVKTVTRVIKS